MKTLLAYHGDEQIKLLYVNRMRDHIAAGELVRGIGWQSNGVTCGCAIGCTLNKYDHAAYQTELGLPEWLARLEDQCFENLPDPHWKDFPLKVLQAIEPGANIEPVRDQLAILRLERCLARLKPNKEKCADKVRDAITQNIEALRDTSQEKLKSESARSAESAARSAARSAESAARSAARSASAAEKESARFNEYIWEAETLLKLLAAAK